MNKKDKTALYICNVILILAGIFLIIYKVLDFKLYFSFFPCYFHDWFHLYCFGCGGTRAVRALLRFDIFDSIMCNPIVLYGGLIFIYFYIGCWLRYYSHKWKKYFIYRKSIVIVGIILMVVVFIVRNGLLIFYQIDYFGELEQFWGN